jgi:integrase
MIKILANEFHERKNATEILEQLYMYYEKNTIASKLSDVKNEYFKKNDFDAHYKENIKRIYPQIPSSFFQLPAKKQIHALKQGLTEDTETNEALRQVNMFHHEFYKLVLPAELNNEIRDNQTQNLTKKLQHAIVISRNEFQCKILAALESERPLENLIGLGACCGRRFAEILFAGQFREDGLFSGQLKKKGKFCEYKIPILFIPYDVFIEKLEQLRIALPCTSPQEAHDKYGSPVNLEMKKLFAPLKLKFHDLRGIYAAFSWEERNIEDERCYNLFIQSILGHETLQQSLNYSHVIVRN